MWSSGPLTNTLIGISQNGIRQEVAVGGGGPGSGGQNVEDICNELNLQNNFQQSDTNAGIEFLLK